jgi:translation initiation factor 1 (eIF-1/SUI1)
MARRKRGKKLTISLFPFLSILACVIGTLTLLITAMALGQMDNDTVATAEDFQRVQDAIEQERQLIESLKEQIEKADNTLKELADIRVKLEELRLKKEALLAQNDEKDEEEEKSPIEIPIVDEEKHKKRMAAIQAEIAKQEALIEELAAELKKRGGPVREAEVIIQPTGSGVDLEPTFVECTAAGIVILEADPPKHVRREDLAADADFCALLDDVTNRPKATVIFLIRDDGVPTYFAASRVARSRYAPNGKVPVIGRGKIDVGLFKK